MFDSDRGLFTVYGFAEDDAPCTLVDCFATSTRQNLFGQGYRSVEIVGHLLVHGAHVEDVDRFEFSQARVELAGLRELFVARFAPEAADPFEAGPVVLSVAGARLEFHRLERRQSGPHRLAVERDVAVEINLDVPLTHVQWRERWITPLLHFVELATREPSQLFDFIALVKDPDDLVPPLLRGHMSPEVSARREVAFIQPRSVLRIAAPVDHYRRVLFDASALGQGFKPAMSRWFDLESQLSQPMGLLLSTLSSRMYVTSQLVVLASVAEAYHRWIDDASAVPAKLHQRVTHAVLDALGDDPHRGHYERSMRFANQLSQTERIRALLERAAIVVPPLGRKPGRLAERIGQTRNALVHLPADSREVLQGLDLVEAVGLLVLALQANVLLDLGLQPERAAHFIERSYGQERLWQRLQARDCAWPKGRARRVVRPG